MEVRNGQLGDGNELHGECTADGVNELKVLVLVERSYFGIQAGHGQTSFPSLSTKTRPRICSGLNTR